MDASELRFVGLDLHRHDVMVGAVNAQQTVVLSPQRVTLQRFGQWAARHLRPTDQVAIEATTNTWALYDLLEPQVAKVVVAHPQQVRLIASAKVKHDKRDALILAQLLAANLLPEVWVPPPPVRQLRSLIVHRQHLAKQQRMAKNRLRGVLFRFNIPAPPGDVASPDYRTWWQTTSLNQVEQLRVQHDLDTLAHLANQITEVNAALARLSVCIPWSEDVPFLLQMPGIGLVSAMTILSAVGDITRFPTPKHLVGYAGLGAGVRSSGQTSHTGPITKSGRGELRTTLIQVAWAAVRYSPFWRESFNRLAPHTGTLKAITIIARKILVVIWHVLTDRVPDRHADPAQVERAFLSWATEHRLATSQGVTRTQLVQHALVLVGFRPPD
jgi:transposase